MNSAAAFRGVYAPGHVVAGVDEVGRGCIAGPVVAGAVVFRSTTGIRRFRDSKLLSEPRREELSALIQAEHFWALGIADVDEIEKLNILWASQLAMIRALEALRLKIGEPLTHVFVDGHLKIRDWKACSQSAIVGGDQRVKAIAAGSIVAKVFRDNLMKEIGRSCPEYGFEEHKGYAAPKHRAAIAEHGVTPHHRRSFRGVVEFL